MSILSFLSKRMQLDSQIWQRRWITNVFLYHNFVRILNKCGPVPLTIGIRMVRLSGEVGKKSEWKIMDSDWRPQRETTRSQTSTRFRRLPFRFLPLSWPLRQVRHKQRKTRREFSPPSTTSSLSSTALLRKVHQRIPRLLSTLWSGSRAMREIWVVHIRSRRCQKVRLKALWSIFKYLFFF